MIARVRTPAYMLASLVIWFAEGYVFTRAFAFNLAQTAVVAVYFLLLFAGAVWLSVRFARRVDPSDESIPVARLISLAPVLVLVVGSFAALPVFMLVLIAGALV